MGLSMLATFSLLRPSVGGVFGQVVLILAIFVLGGPISYLLTQPTKVSGAKSSEGPSS